MIDEKKLIEELEKQFKSLIPEDDTDYCKIWQIKQDIKIIDEQPQVGGWIPVTERLPENGYGVLVTVNGKHNNITFIDALEIAEYDSNDGWIIEGYLDWTNPDVTAWMPLPAPYKESDKE